MYKNLVIVIGNLTKAPELKILDSGKIYTNLNIAVNSNWTDDKGVKQESVEFLSFGVFGKQAEYCTQYLVKGQKVYVEGKIKNRVEESADGKRYHTGLIANMVQFGSKPQGGEKSDHDKDRKAGEVEPRGINENDLDYGEINPDDIPF